MLGYIFTLYGGKLAQALVGWLGWAKLWYNMNFHTAMKMTTFRTLYGKEPLLMLKGTAISSTVEDINQ